MPRSGDSYPSSIAAMAGAASRTLEYLYPKYPKARLEERAEDVAQSLVAAGAVYPSDEIVWDGKRPRGKEHWQPPPGSTGQPNRPWAAKAEPWIVKPISRFRPKPPPKYGSKEFIANARDVLKAKTTSLPSRRSSRSSGRGWRARRSRPASGTGWRSSTSATRG